VIYTVRATSPKVPPRDVAAFFDTEGEAKAEGRGYCVAHPGHYQYETIVCRTGWVVQIWTKGGMRGSYVGVLSPKGAAS